MRVREGEGGDTAMQVRARVCVRCTEQVVKLTRVAGPFLEGFRRLQLAPERRDDALPLEVLEHGRKL